MTVQRKIYFYRINVGTTDAGQPILFDPAPPLQALDGLPFDVEGRYWEYDASRVLCLWVDRAAPPQRLRFASIRRSDLPYLETGGNLEPLDVPAGTGLYEPVHVVFFGDNLIGSEFNFYGPRMGSLASSLHRKLPDLVPEMTIGHLLRRDVSDQLARLEDIRLFDFKLASSYVATIRQMDEDLGTALRTLATIGEAQQVHLTLQPERYSRTGTLADRLLDAARNLARRADLRENATVFKVKGHDQELARVVEVDVLRDLLITTRRVVQLGDRSRAVDPQSAYEAIHDAHDELQQDLAEAVALET